MAIAPRNLSIGARPDLQMTLTQYSYDLEAQGYVALAIAPELQAPFAEGTFRLEKVEDATREQTDERQGDGSYTTLSMKFADGSYVTGEYGGEVPVDTKFKNQYREWIDVELAATQLSRRNLARNHQRRTISAVFGISKTAAAGGGLNVEATDIFGEFSAYKKTVRANCGMLPNVCVMEWELYDALRQHPVLLNRVKYDGNHDTSLKTLNRQMLADVLDLEEVIVSTAMTNTANENKDAVLAARWPKEKLLLFVRSNSMIPSDIQFARTVTWDEEGGGCIQSTGTTFMGCAMDTYLDDRRRGVVYRNRGQYGIKIMTEQAGLVVTGAFV